MFKIGSLTFCAVATLAVAAQPATAAPIDLQPYATTNVGLFSSGEDYPQGSTTIGGIDFDLPTVGGGPGIVFLTESNDTVSINVGQTMVDTIYLILNSSGGTFGATIGQFTFTALNGSNLVVPITEGINIRDHYQGFFNNVTTTAFATQQYDGGNRYDVYRYDLSALGGTLATIDFSSLIVDQQIGYPFLAGATATLENNIIPDPNPVPEPSSLALLALGALGLGGVVRKARSDEKKSIDCA